MYLLFQSDQGLFWCGAFISVGNSISLCLAADRCHKNGDIIWDNIIFSKYIYIHLYNYWERPKNIILYLSITSRKLNVDSFTHRWLFRCLKPKSSTWMQQDATGHDTGPSTRLGPGRWCFIFLTFLHISRWIRRLHQSHGNGGLGEP